MSTANFPYPRGTSRHFTIGLDQDLEDFEYDDVIDNITNDILEIKTLFESDLTDEWLDRESRSLVRFAIPYYDREYGDWDHVYIHVFVVSGYYAGAMFDVDTSELEEVTLNKKTERMVTTLINKIEKVLDRYCLSLVRVATFSNGEAVYEPYDNQKSRIKAIVGGHL